MTSLIYNETYTNIAHIENITGSLFGLPTIKGPTGSIGYQGQIGPQGLEGPTGAGGALGYYGSFYDTTIQSNVVGGNTGIAMTFNTIAEANGVSVVDNSKIKVDNGAVYNIQFSAQFDKTDSGTDNVDIWLAKNGLYVPDTNTKITSDGNNDKFVASWNFMLSLNANDYIELYWASSDDSMRIFSQFATGVPYTIPAIPSVILTVQQVMNTQIGPTGVQGPTGSIGPQGIAGPNGGTNTQILFNQSGIATGSNSLTFNNSLLSTTNLSVSASGTFNNLFLNNNTIHLGTNAGSTGQGGNSIAIGGSAGFSFQNINSVAIGNSAGNTAQGQYAVGVGYRAGGTTQGTSTVAIGQDAGRLTQGNSSIAIGPSAGYSSQSNNSIAIGNGPGYTSQGSYAIAIGDNAGQTNQSLESIAIGRNAGFSNLGQYSIAIGKNASQNTGVASSIVLNAQNAALDATQSGFYVNPVRTFNGTGSNFLTYTNNEITQDSNFIFNQSTGYVMNKSLTIQTGSNLNAPGTYHVRLGLTSDKSLTGAYDYKIPFSSFSDPNNWYNASTYRITPTVPGYYYVSYQVNCGSGTPGNQTNAQIRKNDGTIAISVFPVSTVSNYTIHTFSTVYLNGISDYIDCTVFTSSTTTQTVTGEAQGTWTKLDMFKLN